MIGPGSILKYEKGEYSILKGENIFDLYKTLPIDSQYCKAENVYYTPEGKFTKDELEGTQEEKGFFQKIHNKWQEFKQRIKQWFAK